MSRPSDHRLHESWASYCERLSAEHPEREVATAGESNFGSFVSGWHYRYEAAKAGTGAAEEGDLAVIHDQMDLVHREFKRSFDQVFKAYETNNRLRRWLTDCHEQIRALRGDPIDAPAYSRISNQRREIKRLTQENDHLRSQLAAQTDTKESK